MKMPKKMKPEMIAPCGINCLACSAHLREKKPCPGCKAPVEQITRKSCRECRIKKCAYEKGNKWCFECMSFPCPRIEKLTIRYMKNCCVNLIQNGRDADNDMTKFLKSQKDLFTCKSCEGIINQHQKTCSECGKEANLLPSVLPDSKEQKYTFRLLEDIDYKDRKNLIAKFEAAYGNEHIFKYAMLKLLKEHEKKATVFGLYFGYQKDPLSFSEIGKHLNLSTTRVGVLCHEAFRRLNWFKFRREVWEEYGYKEKKKKE
jgi:hypothetical protein